MVGLPSRIVIPCDKNIGCDGLKTGMTNLGGMVLFLLLPQLIRMEIQVATSCDCCGCGTINIRATESMESLQVGTKAFTSVPLAKRCLYTKCTRLRRGQRIWSVVFQRCSQFHYHEGSNQVWNKDLTTVFGHRLLKGQTLGKFLCRKPYVWTAPGVWSYCRQAGWASWYFQRKSGIYYSFLAVSNDQRQIHANLWDWWRFGKINAIITFWLNTFDSKVILWLLHIEPGGTDDGAEGLHPVPLLVSKGDVNRWSPGITEALLLNAARVDHWKSD